MQIELLKRQSEAIRLLQEQYVRWMHEIDNPKIREMHYGLAQALEQALKQYGILLEELEAQISISRHEGI